MSVNASIPLANLACLIDAPNGSTLVDVRSDEDFSTDPTSIPGVMRRDCASVALPPLLAGALGGLLTTWVTFTPCFLWIFLGAPYIEQVRGNKALTGALSAITAAVVDVILNLAIWFAIHTIFHQIIPVRELGFAFDLPFPVSVDLWALMLSLGAVLAIFRSRPACCKRSAPARPLACCCSLSAE
jgi:chromate transport protein ChrA